MEVPGVRAGRQARRGRHYANLVGRDVLPSVDQFYFVPEIDWKKVRKKEWQTRLEEEAVGASDLQLEHSATSALDGCGCLAELQSSHAASAGQPRIPDYTSSAELVPRHLLQTVKSSGEHR